MTIATEPTAAHEWSAWTTPTSDVPANLATGALALQFAAAEGLHPDDLASQPLVLDQSGVFRWPLGPGRHFRPPLRAGERRSPIFSTSHHRRFYDENRDGLVKRDFFHPDGRFGIGVHESSLRIEIGPNGSAAVFRAIGRHCTVHIPQRLPASVRLSLVGRNLNDVVAHEFFASHRLRIASVAETPRGATRITVYDAPVRITALTRVRLASVPDYEVFDDDDVPF